VTRLLLATTNPGKQRELARLLASVPAELVVPQAVGLDLEVAEPHPTSAENAEAKARAYARASGLLSVADDSGIEVAALDWGPGPRSARFGPRVGGDADRLLAALGDTADRRARMVCVLAVAIPGAGSRREPRVELFSGVLDGTIARQRRGGGGFGYDPIFLLPSGMTTAELPEEEKDRISHRGQAVAAALPRLNELLDGGA
jgi:XTP/dITP diphosphohydrolase